jgi:hydroxymethylpyrimidine pyrophosphatase-like HAD family hydrolase
MPKLDHSTAGDYARGLDEMRSYFPEGDLSREPRLSDPGARWYLFNELAICLTGLGRCEEASPFHQRNIEAGLAAKEVTGPRAAYANLAELHLHSGDYEQMLLAAKNAFALSQDPEWQRDTLVLVGWAAHQLGDLDMATAAFEQVDRLSGRKDVEPLADIWAILRAEVLSAAGRTKSARKLLESVAADPAPHVAAQALGAMGDYERAFALVGPTSAELVKRDLMRRQKIAAFGAEAMATDYDDTLAQDGKMSSATEAALDRWRSSGRKSILVSGRPLYDLLPTELNRRGEHAPPLDPQAERHFDLVVAENGGVIWDPRTTEVIDLCPHVPEGLIEALISAGVPDDCLWAGRTVVASKLQYIDAIRRGIEGLPVEISLNRESVMLLPKGVDKASGLRAACELLGTSVERTAGFGDAANDLPFLSACGLSIAVANAEDQVKAIVSLVARGRRGDGVRETLDALRSA